MEMNMQYLTLQDVLDDIEVQIHEMFEKLGPFADDPAVNEAIAELQRAHYTITKLRDSLKPKD